MGAQAGKSQAFLRTKETSVMTTGRNFAMGLATAAVFLVISLICSTPTIMADGSVYRTALDQSLLFFEAQRSGLLPHGQRVHWRQHSGLKDGFASGVDLVGGYYDAGDHVKFGFPMAYAMTMISWGAIEFQKEITAANEMNNVLDAIKWGTDYFLKCHRQPNLLWCQVGDGSSDHFCWQRPEDITTSRNAYSVDANHPGSDVAAETAAALAAASIAFAPFDSKYSTTLLLHAKQLFTFADRFRGRYDDSITAAHDFYPSSGYYDELLWAATWLFKATKEPNYLQYVVDNAVTLSGTTYAVKEFSWDNKYAGLQTLLAKVWMDNAAQTSNATLKQYQAKAEYFMCAQLQKNAGFNVQLTPGGLLYFHEWNNMQYVSASAFLLSVYSNYLSTSNSNLNCPDGQVPASDLVKFAQSQADYMLGNNPKNISYFIGYGSNFPTNVHHRGASITSKSFLGSIVGCLDGFERWFSNWQGNPNVLTGALVGGPDMMDQFNDARSNYEQTEPSLAGNAPLIGLFAKLDGLSGSGYSQPMFAARHYTTTKVPVKFVHFITNSWTSNGTAHYSHSVTVKNIGQSPITELKLQFENLTGHLWGLSPTSQPNVFELPPWLPYFLPGTEFMFVYIQGGPQAKISVLSYH